MASRIRTQLYLDQHQKKLLEKRAGETGKSIGCLVREAIDEVYWKRPVREKTISREDPFWEMIGSGRSREANISSRHDESLYTSGK